MKQFISTPTRTDAILELLLTDLHPFFHPPTTLPPLQVDEGKKGKDSDHQALILAPKASKDFVVKREKRKIVTRSMPESKIGAFCCELTNHRWENVLETENVNEKTEAFHTYLVNLLDKYFPTKTVTISSLDKYWMTPQLKQLLRQVQRERLMKGKGGKFKKLWAKFRKLKRRQVKSYYQVFFLKI